MLAPCLDTWLERVRIFPQHVLCGNAKFDRCIEFIMHRVTSTFEHLIRIALTKPKLVTRVIHFQNDKKAYIRLYQN